MAITKEDEVLLSRIRKLVARRKGFVEKTMFGGKAFFLHGNMCVGTWKGSLVVRMDKADHDATQSEPHTAPMDITGKVMKGWALVRPQGIKSDDDLKVWINRAAKHVATLPKK